MRLTLERAPTSSVCADIWDRSQCNSGVTLCSRPKDAALTANRFHVFTGVRKGDLSNGCTSVSEVIVILATVTVSDAAVASGSIGVPGSVSERELSSSVMVGVATSWTENQSSSTSMVVGRILRQTS